MWLDADALYALKGGGFGGEVGLVTRKGAINRYYLYIVRRLGILAKAWVLLGAIRVLGHAVQTHRLTWYRSLGLMKLEALPSQTYVSATYAKRCPLQIILPRTIEPH